VIDAPAKEIAIGRKISDFATAAPAETVGQRREQQADADRRQGTTMIHNAVF
jgi:hypothetical protein